MAPPQHPKQLWLLSVASLRHFTEKLKREGNFCTTMAIAATISLPITSPSGRSRASIPYLRSSFSFILQLDSIAKISARRTSPRLSVSSSSTGLGVTEKAPSLSFLDRRESGVLHFVKYHGLGNDFILVLIHRVYCLMFLVLFILKLAVNACYYLNIICWSFGVWHGGSLRLSL